MTSEILGHPAGASMVDFGWRASIAEISESGSFSEFAGIDRHLTVIRGAVRVSSPDLGAAILRPDSGAFGFAGDAEVHAEVTEAPLLVFNVMTDRQHLAAQLHHIRSRSAEILEFDTAAVVLATGAARFGGTRLGPLDAATLSGGEPATAALEVYDGWLHVATFQPRARPITTTV